MAAIEIDRISLKFGGLVVLNEVSFSVEQGELFALIGPNGAGKTTVFNCISGICQPQGSIRFQQQNIVGRKPYDIAAMGIGRTFQHGELFPHMTVMENLLTARHNNIKTNPFSEMLRLPAARRQEEQHRTAIMDIIRLVELEAYTDTPVGGLPFGLQKIIGFARALAAEPQLLLMDEPSAGLTREEREDLAYFILKTKVKLGIGMIWIEHDMQMVADMADRIHVLDYGRSLAEGTPDKVLNDETVIKAYLGTA